MGIIELLIGVVLAAIAVLLIILVAPKLMPNYFWGGIFCIIASILLVTASAALINDGLRKAWSFAQPKEEPKAAPEIPGILQ